MDPLQKAMRDGGPAFPHRHEDRWQNAEGRITNTGMSLRDWFAGVALQGLCAHPESKAGSDQNMERYVSMLASISYRVADAMLNERAR